MGDTMELAEFVETTLKEILKGVREAQGPGWAPIQPGNPGVINPSAIMYQADSAPKGRYFATVGGRLVHFVQFDVAVTAESGDKVSGGGKINVFGVGVGSEGSVMSKDTIVSRVKFEVPIQFPEAK